jgi:NitT/TauT family transport system ATP-binding protein
MVHLSHVADRHPHELSGGMRQRVSIARALVLRPEVLLMDEPFSALDAQTRTILQDELQRIWLETRPAVVFVTHNLLEAAFLADTVYLLSAGPGRIVQRYAVDVPRPRDEGDPRLVAIRQDMLHRMRAEVDTAAGRTPGEGSRLIGATTE